MKKLSLLFCLIILVSFGYRSYASAYTVTISSGLPSDTVCSSTPITFTATPSGSGTYGYIWNVNGSYVGTSSSTYTTTLLTGTDVVYCLLTNAAGDSIFAASDTLNMLVDSLPVISPIYALTTDSLCVGDTISLGDATPGGVWASGNTASATVDATGGVTGIALPMGGGFGGPTVRIYYTVTNSCGSDSVRFRVYLGTPASAISLAATTVCIDSAITINDSSRGGTWTSSDSTIGTVAFNFGTGFPPMPVEQLTGVSAGTVTITYDITNACGTYNETATVTVINCDSTATAVSKVVSLANSCNIYPNPSTGAFNIMARSSRYSQANCTVSNMVGEKVKNFTINTNQENSVGLGMPTGVYFITVSAGDEKYTSKLVIMQ